MLYRLTDQGLQEGLGSAGESTQVRDVRRYGQHDLFERSLRLEQLENQILQLLYLRKLYTYQSL